MTKILTVCLGNICRSPMAEGIISHIARTENISFEIDSCGTGGWHAGEMPDPRARAYMKQRGISIDHLRARQINSADLDNFDHILVMDKSNLQNVLAMCKNDAQRNKVKLMLDYWPESPTQEVPDPYYGGDEGFADVFNLIHNAAVNFVNTLK